MSSTLTPSPTNLQPTPRTIPHVAQKMNNSTKPNAGQTAPATSLSPNYRRGDIWMVRENPTQAPVGTELWSNRPAIILSNNVSANHSGFVQVVYLTTSARKRSGPTHIPIPNTKPNPNSKGETPDAIALCEQIHTVDVSRLGRKLGIVSRNKMSEVDQAVALSLSIGRNPDTSSLFKKWENYIQLHGIDMAAEIQALAGHTTDQRVEALTRALELVTTERDSYRSLYEASRELPAALRQIAEHTQEQPSES